MSGMGRTGAMHRYHSPVSTAPAGPEASPIVPSYYLGRPSRVYIARFRRRSAGTVSERR